MAISRFDFEIVYEVSRALMLSSWRPDCRIIMLTIVSVEPQDRNEQCQGVEVQGGRVHGVVGASVALGMLEASHDRGLLRQHQR